MATDAIFVVDPVGYAHAFKSWDGIVGQDMTRRVLKGTAAAIATAPGPGKPPRNRTGINYSTGRLIATIHPEFGMYNTEVEGRVVAGTPEAVFVHGGTRPHIIRPRKAGGKLVFNWAKRGGALVALDVVHHPGSRAVPFLAEHLRLMAH